MSMQRTGSSTLLSTAHPEPRRGAGSRRVAGQAGVAALLVGVGLVFGLSGCGREQAAAKAELAQVEAACAKGDPEAARAALASGAEKSRVFSGALESAQANWGGADLATVNPCGVLLEDLSRRLQSP